MSESQCEGDQLRLWKMAKLGGVQTPWTNWTNIIWRGWSCRRYHHACQKSKRWAGSPSNTMWSGWRPTFIPSGILINPTVWLQYTNVTDRQDRRQERQRCVSIGRVVFQTVAQKLSKRLRGTVVERLSLGVQLSLSCARPAADGWPLMWVNHLLQVSQPGQFILSSFRGRQMSSKQ